MDPNRPTPTTIDAYIAGFPPDVQARLQAIRALVREVAPGAQEAIKYAMPTFILGGKNLVHFAAYARHIGFYPTPSGLDAFADDLAAYPTSKGTVQFPLDREIPYDLIRRIVEYRVQEVSKKK